MEITGILFDIGDTLLPASRLQHEVLMATANQMRDEGLVDNATRLCRAYETADVEPEFDDLMDLNHLYADERVLKRACELANVNCAPEFMVRFLELYKSRLRLTIVPSPGLSETLRRLSELGVRLGIVSNGTTVEQLDQLHLLDVAAMFDPIVISQERGMRKPDPRMFWIASTSWSMSPQSVLVVGDRPDLDVGGAIAAGMQSALTTEFVDYRDRITPALNPTYVISDLRMLLTMAR
jgi:FMN phosphatase YigB (HAD superfamily)